MLETKEQAWTRAARQASRYFDRHPQKRPSSIDAWLRGIRNRLRSERKQDHPEHAGLSWWSRTGTEPLDEPAASKAAPSAFDLPDDAPEIDRWKLRDDAWRKYTAEKDRESVPAAERPRNLSERLAAKLGRPVRP